MKNLIWNSLGFKSSQTDSEKRTARALPASWYRSDNLYELERRAIFSKKWLLVTHKLRLPENGDWVKFEEAGFQFFICRDREGTIRGFHNICRHRAFPLVTGEAGNSKILACQYHGWSYGLNGKLAKAPGYQELEGFDRASNNLFPLHVHIDNNGFIWVNLDSSSQPEIKWSDDFHGVDTQNRFKYYNFDDYKFDHTWKMSGEYNWKTLADNYNECYHCPTAHPDTAGLVEVNIYSVETAGAHIQHFSNMKREQLDEGNRIASTFYFPNACMTVA